MKLKRQRLYRTIALGGLGLLCLHFILTFCYTMPSQFVPDRGAFYAKKYMSPTFFQSWRLFAPDVDDVRLEISYKAKFGEAWGGWQDFTLENTTLDNQRNRYMADKNMHYLAYEMRRGLTYNEDGEPQYDAVLMSGPFKRVVRFLAMVQKRIAGEEPDGIQLKIKAYRIPPFRGKREPDDRIFIFPPAERE